MGGPARPSTRNPDPHSVLQPGRAGASLRMTRTTADWETLQSSIGGAVVLPEAPDYDAVRIPAMARFEAVRPEGVVLCGSSDDVAAAIAFARRAGLETRVRSGGTQ